MNEAVDDADVVVTVSTLVPVPPAVRAKLVGFNVVYKPRKESLNVGLPLLLHLLIVG